MTERMKTLICTLSMKEPIVRFHFKLLCTHFTVHLMTDVNTKSNELQRIYFRDPKLLMYWY